MGTCSVCGSWRHIHVVLRGLTHFLSVCAFCIGLLVAQEQFPVAPEPTPTVITWPGTPGALGPSVFGL